MYKIKKMPEDVHTSLQGTLGLLEGLLNSPDLLFSTKSHLNLLKNINSLIGSGEEITSEDAERVLRVCLQNDLDMRFAPYMLSIISTLLSIDKEKSFSPSIDFLPSALTVLAFLRKCAEDNKNSIRTLAYQVLMAHPDSTLINLVRNHCAVLFETFNLFYTLHIGFSENKIETFILLQFLNVLPTTEKSQFVKEGIPMWFNNILPCLMQILVSVEESEKVENCLSYAEILAEQLVLHNYFDYPEWQLFLLNIVDPTKYSICIKSLLDKGKGTWYRIWILLVKLLKGQVTRSISTYGTPINSLLPVVEAAFKMDSTQRIQAFTCWDELIRNFSNEINLNEANASCIGKRLKLVVIPLRLNNAKTNHAVIAKFNTWWLLIQRFKPKLGKFTNEILIPFLVFLFGKRNLIKQPFWAGKVSNDMRQRCLEAFVEIVGHNECDGCTTVIEPLNGKVITTVMLADHWDDWLFSLKTVVTVVAINASSTARKKLRCLWKSFILLMTELLDNSVRRDWLNDIVNLVSVLAQESDSYISLIEIIMEDLTLPLYGDPNIHTLLNSKSQDHRPMHKIVAITTGKMFDSFYRRYDPDELQKTLDPLVTALLNEAKTSPGYMMLFLDELPLTDNTLKLWTVLARKATESDLCLQVFKSLLLWPLKTVLTANDVKDAALAWYTLYNTVHLKLDKIGFDSEISKLLIKPVDDSKATNYFILFALIGVLKYKPNEDKMAKLEALTYEMHVYEEFEPLIPALIDTLALMIDNSSEKMYENLAQITMNCISNVLNVINSETKSKLSNPSASRETSFSDARTNLSSINKTVLTDTITTAMKKFLAKSTNDSIKKEVQGVISSLENGVNKCAVKSPIKTDTVPKEFTSPKLLDIKKNKKKDPSIVNTVMENGEEYVVVKSHWKFNPKNLTENQKEKLQRKRDIPALYQDLSQSQDEFKLTAWKTDSNSQDTSISSSKSSKSTNNNDAEVLKNMPSSDVVPKILENILDNAKNTQQKSDVTSPTTIDKVIKVDKVTTPQSTKSPRMALKDRVFRNVRNLIEKSSPPRCETKNKDITIPDNASVTPIVRPSNEIIDIKDDSKQIEVSKSPLSKSATEENVAENKQAKQIPMVTIPSERIMNKVIIVTAKQNEQNITLVCTPLSKARTDNTITNSAPLLTAERPARMKRKPKKFDDSLLLAFKKSRHSNNESQDSQDLQNVEHEITVAQVHAPKEKIEIAEINQTAKMVEANIIDNTTKPVDVKTRKTEDVIVLSSDFIECNTPKHQEIAESHKVKNIVTPTTPISNKSTEKSPEKPTTSVEVPTDKDKASEGIEKDSAKKLLEENKELRKLLKTQKALKVVQQKTPVKRKQEIITPLIKTRKAKLQNAASMTPETTATDSDVKTILSKTRDVEVETRQKNTEMDVVSTPVNKTCKSKDGQQMCTKKNIPQNETIKHDSQLESVTPTEVINTPKPAEKIKKATKENECKTDDKVPVTQNIKHRDSDPKLSVKKPKKSRIEKELMIDTVEGHPFLKSQSEKRLTRKKIMEAENSGRRKSLAEKLNKSKLEATPKTSKKTKEKKASPTNSITVEESQDKQNSSDVTMEEPPCSEDIIESSQDSTMTTISVKSTKRTPKRQPVVTLERVDIDATGTQELIQDNEVIILNNETTEKTITSSLNCQKLSPNRRAVIALERVEIESPKTQELIQNSEVNVPNDTFDKTDIELSQNKTAEVDKNVTDLTENMDTEPMGDKKSSDDVIILDETQPSPITIHSEPIIGAETQELADADTQPNDPEQFAQFEEFTDVNKHQPPIAGIEIESVEATDINIENIDETNDVSSPYKDDTVRKQDFLNNTLEISPIKVQSPDREKKSPSPETSSDFVVIQLSSPVHSNGEPFEKHGSPEFFSEDKVSPDKRDASPPRLEVTVTNTSPSSSLSLKKNRPQVRPTGRAAQMLDLLCVHSDLKVTKVPERVETEETKKAPASTPARRNLRILYNSVGDVSDCEMPEQNVEEMDNFLKLKRSLPTVTSSPSGPILKRKLIDIADEATTSPASKRKRVSFHDPPVSTTMSVHKYIEPLSMVRSPQSSAKKRLERQPRTALKSPKRLENAFNLDSVLSKTVESFTETPSDDTQNTSLEVTPVLEIIKTSELNDTDPLYPELIDCKEPIQVIATELSSPAMSELFVKELEGKVETIGDLAKLTELEINRLCIKAPKIQVARKVLTDYAKQPVKVVVDAAIEEAFSEPMTVSLLDKTVSVEMQTDAVEISSTEIQTDMAAVILAATQTESILTAQTSMQTDDANTEDVISTCLNNEDFLKKLTEKLDEESIKKIAETLPPKSLFDLLIKKSDDTSVCNRLLKLHSKGLPKNKKSSAELSFVQDLLCKRYENSDLILLCSQLLQKIHDAKEKPAK